MVNSQAVDISTSLDKIESFLKESYTSHVLETQVNAMCLHVINAGGKRMRPRLLLLCAHALPLFNAERDEDSICHVAAAVELLHTATLVHDDVIDKAPIRRGVETLNEQDGNHAAVLAGDYLFTRCFDLIQRPKNFDIIQELNHTLSQLVVGELYQLEHEGDVELSVDTYYRTIYAKTGVLFEFAASAPAFLIENQTEFIEPLKKFGRCLGMAFQIKDDMLDFSATKEDLGKDVGADLEDSRVTLPMLMALQATHDASAKAKLVEHIKNHELEPVKEAIEKTHALEHCEGHAKEMCREAIEHLAALPDNTYKAELVKLCEYALQRNA